MLIVLHKKFKIKDIQTQLNNLDYLDKSTKPAYITKRTEIIAGIRNVKIQKKTTFSKPLIKITIVQVVKIIDVNTYSI